MVVWRVSQGSHNRWFADEGDAKQYAKDRYDSHLDGIPFVESIDAREMIARINELESSKQLGAEFCS
jgi:hypothetical protein